MKLIQQAEGDLLVLRLGGQLMGGPDADALRATILSSIQQGTEKIMIDLAEITWVNSTGLGILITSHLAARSKGGSLKLIGVSKRIESILSVTRLNTVFDIYPTEEEARKSFKTSPSGTL
jgi:anti-sigma B factor antagonist